MFAMLSELNLVVLRAGACRWARPAFFAVTLAIFLLQSSCSTPQKPPRAPLPVGAAPTVTRSQSLQIAEAYATHRWRASKANVFQGLDSHGVSVDTPDEDYKPVGGFAGWWKADSWNVGLPYKWGGFDTLEEFDRGVKAGLYAGDVFTARKRELDNHAVSQYTAGVDCSGFIARCWRMPAAFSTYEIQKHCEPLSTLEDLKPGDVVNKENAHISLFAGWEDKAHSLMLVYDVGCPPNWKVLKHGVFVSWLQANGYKAWRYRHIED